MSLSNLLGIPKYNGVLFGIECEVESKRGELPGFAPQGSGINAIHDGSLRNGMEYVFSRPKDLKTSLKTLSVLFRFLGENSVPSYSFRTSTHVHVNVSDLTVPQITSIIYLYTLVEDLFVNFCEPHRRGNRFCLRFRDANNLYEILGNLVRNKNQAHSHHVFQAFDQGQMKYAALNFYTLLKYGTLEFRSLEGTNDLVKIEKWLTAISNMVTVGKQFDSVAAAHEAFFNNPSAMVDAIFTEDFKFDGWRNSVEEAYSQSYQVVLSEKENF